MAGNVTRSKLYAYRSELSEWRRLGKSHSEMAELLQQEKGVKASPSTIFEFLKNLEDSAEPEVKNPVAEPAAMQKQLTRIEESLEALRAALVLSNPTEPQSPLSDPDANFARLEKSINQMAASFADSLKTADQAAVVRHEVLTKTLAVLPNQLEKLTPKTGPALLPQSTIPKPNVGRIWLRAIILTSLFWLAVWWLTKK